MRAPYMTCGPYIEDHPVADRHWKALSHYIPLVNATVMSNEILFFHFMQATPSTATFERSRESPEKFADFNTAR
jgi:hypothetical protein